MFTKSRKETFVEQAQDLARDISEAVTPHVEKAKDELVTALETAPGYRQAQKLLLELNSAESGTSKDPIKK